MKKTEHKQTLIHYLVHEHLEVSQKSLHLQRLLFNNEINKSNDPTAAEMTSSTVFNST